LGWPVRIALALMLGFLTAPAARGLPARDVAGVVLHPWHLENPEVRERAFAGIAATGVRWARVDLSWNRVERHGPSLASGRADWRSMDAIVHSAHRHGVNLLPVVACTPAWASSEGDSWAYPDAQPFENFFAAALRRYPQIPAWELWNEPNLGVFAKPRPDPAGFVELLRSARRARESVGSTAKLVAGGLSPHGEIDILSWVDEVARRGGLDLVDGLGVHPYSVAEPDDPRSWMMRLEDLHDRLAAVGSPDLPLWLTEYGAPSAMTASGYAPPMTEEQQAERLRVAFALAIRWPWVERLIWYEYRDGCAGSANPECNFGLVRADLSPKAAYHALRDVIGGVTMKLRPRLSLRSRLELGAPRAVPHRRLTHRMTLTGGLFLPGSPPATTRITARLMRRGARPRRVSIAVRNGVFSSQLMGRGPRPRTVEARFKGSEDYERVTTRAPVRKRETRAHCQARSEQPPD
jgi:hypothetical protein